MGGWNDADEKVEVKADFLGYIWIFNAYSET